MTTLTAAVEATLARRDADAAAREEQREAIALHVLKPDRWSEDDIILGYPEDVAADIRATPLDATPLADELAALRADLAHALGVRDAAMEAETKAETERDALRAQRDALQATLCDLSAAFDKRGAQRDAAVEALAEIARPKRGGIEANDTDEAWIEYLSMALERERSTARAALLLARGTP